MSPAQRRRDAHQYRRTAALFASFLMSLGLVMLLLGGFGAWRGWQTLSWPTASATILSSALAEEETTRTVPMTDRLRGGTKETVESVHLDIRYRYVVEGVTFEGTSIEPWDFGVQSLSKARDLAARASAGSAGQPVTIPVAYDSRDPRRVYLAPGPSTTAMTMGTVGAVLVALGFIMGRIQRRA